MGTVGTISAKGGNIPKGECRGGGGGREEVLNVREGEGERRGEVRN